MTSNEVSEATVDLEDGKDSVNWIFFDIDKNRKTSCTNKTVRQSSSNNILTVTSEGKLAMSTTLWPPDPRIMFQGLMGSVADGIGR